MQPSPRPIRYAICTLDGTELDSRPTYFGALLHAYSIRRMGTFTIEERHDNKKEPAQ